MTASRNPYFIFALFLITFLLWKNFKHLQEYNEAPYIITQFQWFSTITSLVSSTLIHCSTPQIILKQVQSHITLLFSKFFFMIQNNLFCKHYIYIYKYMYDVLYIHGLDSYLRTALSANWKIIFYKIKVWKYKII